MTTQIEQLTQDFQKGKISDSKKVVASSFHLAIQLTAYLQTKIENDPESLRGLLEEHLQWPAFLTINAETNERHRKFLIERGLGRKAKLDLGGFAGWDNPTRPEYRLILGLLADIERIKSGMSHDAPELAHLRLSPSLIKRCKNLSKAGPSKSNINQWWKVMSALLKVNRLKVDDMPMLNHLAPNLKNHVKSGNRESKLKYKLGRIFKTMLKAR